MCNEKTGTVDMQSTFSPWRQCRFVFRQIQSLLGTWIDVSLWDISTRYFYVVIENEWAFLICSLSGENDTETAYSADTSLLLQRHWVPTKTEVSDPKNSERHKHAAPCWLRGLRARGSSRAHHLITLTALPSSIIKGEAQRWDSWREERVASVLELLNISWMQARAGKASA